MANPQAMKTQPNNNQRIAKLENTVRGLEMVVQKMSQALMSFRQPLTDLSQRTSDLETICTALTTLGVGEQALDAEVARLQSEAETERRNHVKFAIQKNIDDGHFVDATDEPGTECYFIGTENINGEEKFMAVMPRHFQDLKNQTAIASSKVGDKLTLVEGQVLTIERILAPNKNPPKAPEVQAPAAQVAEAADAQ